MRAHLVWAVLLCLALGWAGWAEYRVQGRDLQAAQVSLSHQQALTAAVEKARAEERTIQLKQAKVIDETTQENRKLQADAVRAAAVAGGLRGDVASLRARLASQDSTPACDCSASREAAGVLGELLAECSDRRAAVARYADQAGSAARQCARLYDALTPPAEGVADPTP